MAISLDFVRPTSDALGTAARPAARGLSVRELVALAGRMLRTIGDAVLPSSLERQLARMERPARLNDATLAPASDADALRAMKLRIERRRAQRARRGGLFAMR
jgi:hypothetical protein